MLLVLNVAYQSMVAAHVARDLHRCKAWASNWLKRYDEEGIEGLRDRPKSGRHSQISEQTEYKIKTILKESNSGWTTKQVEELSKGEWKALSPYPHMPHPSQVGF